MNSQARGTVVSIQYLRGAAALLVVACHTNWLSSPLYGQQGVDLFFVISGFIMMLVSERHASPGRFLLARFIRVAPLYWLATFWWAATHADHTARELVQSLLFWPYRVLGGEIWPVLPHGWTLLYEMFFYGVFSICLLLAARGRFTMLGVLTLGLVGLAGLGAIFRPIAAPLVVATDPIILEFLAGAWLHRVWRGGWLPGIGGAVALVSIGLAAGVLTRDAPPETWRPLAWGLPALLIVAGALAWEKAGWLPRVPGALLLGASSYALYLTHRFPLVLVQPLAKAHLGPNLAMTAVIAAAAAVGVAVHLLVERPLHAVLVGSLPRRLNGERVPQAAEANLSGKAGKLEDMLLNAPPVHQPILADEPRP